MPEEVPVEPEVDAGGEVGLDGFAIEERLAGEVGAAVLGVVDGAQQQAVGVAVQRGGELQLLGSDWGRTGI